MKKNNVLGTSDAWSMRGSSHQPSNPLYYIEDCQSLAQTDNPCCLYELNELKFCEVSQNPKSSRCWKLEKNLYLIIVSKLFLMESTNWVTFSLLELNKHLLHFHTGSDRWKDSGSKFPLHFGHKIADKKVPFSVGSWHKLHWQMKNLESFNVFNLFWVLISKLQ